MYFNLSHCSNYLQLFTGPGGSHSSVNQFLRGQGDQAQPRNLRLSALPLPLLYSNHTVLVSLYADVYIHILYSTLPWYVFSCGVRVDLYSVLVFPVQRTRAGVER